MLELVDLSRRYGDAVALDRVSFTVNPGEIVGFVGRNGAGKTTAMRIALGLVEPDRGTVRWAGAEPDQRVRATAFGGHHPRCPERGAGRRRRGDRGAGRLVCRHGATVLARALRPRGRCRPAGPGRSGGRPHHSCHLLRELRHPDAPTVLDAVAGCQRVVWPADERCCGFGGLFSVKLPEVSVAMADDKLRSLAALDPPADEVVSADASCLLHLRGRGEAEGVAVRTRHVAEVLAAALPRPGRTDGSANR